MRCIAEVQDSMDAQYGVICALLDEVDCDALITEAALDSGPNTMEPCNLPLVKNYKDFVRAVKIVQEAFKCDPQDCDPD
jgi:hypothetical protein